MDNLTEQLLETLEEKKNQHLPKYVQLANAFKNLIELGKLAAHEKMPSINELVFDIEISKDTIEKAYTILKKENYISSFRGKGTFVNAGFAQSALKVLLVFNKMSSSKKKTFEAFMEEAGDSLEVDLLIHDYSVKNLKRILAEQHEKYNYFVIIPIFKKLDEQELDKALKLIPAKRTLLLNKQEDSLSNSLFSVYEDFSEDIFQILEQSIIKITRYKQLHLIIPKAQSRVFNKIWNGFVRFCLHYSIPYKVSPQYEEGNVEAETAYILVDDKDLANLIKDCRTNNYELGKNIGIISYNDSPLKEIVEGGITVVSTDFETMGKMAARQVKNRELENVKVPFSMISRKSF